MYEARSVCQGIVINYPSKHTAESVVFLSKAGGCSLASFFNK